MDRETLVRCSRLPEGPEAMSKNNRRTDRLDALEARLTGPKRIALFGHRNVGKTTLLAMFYRQASSGRVPGLRLAAADAQTAEYLAEKIAQIESGQPMAGSLAETELKLRLYHGPARFDLIVKDYQGEHVTLGSRRADPGVLRRLRRRVPLPRPRGLDRPGRAPASAAGGREPAGALHRPLRRPEHGPAGRAAPDQVRPRAGRAARRRSRRPGSSRPSRPPELVERLVDERYGMTRHALAEHAPGRGDLRGQLVRPGRQRQPAAGGAAPAGPGGPARLAGRAARGPRPRRR